MDVCVLHAKIGNKVMVTVVDGSYVWKSEQIDGFTGCYWKTLFLSMYMDQVNR